MRNFVRTVIHQCLTCYRFNAQRTQHFMRVPPSTLVQTSKISHTTCVDYAGPISLRLGPPHRKTITKGYIAIFVFFVTKSVHIEIVTSLSTEAFLAALKRFIARREKPRTICLENSTRFQRAANEFNAV